MVIKQTAEGTDVWKYIDPSKTTQEIENLEPPMPPAPAEYGGTNPSNIPANNQAGWATANRIYDRQEKSYRRAKDNLLAVDRHILSHVARTWLHLIENISTTHASLIALKEVFSPTEKDREQEILRQYKSIKAFNPK